MINLLKHKPFLELLATCEPSQRQAPLETASPEQVHCLCLCAENIINRNYIVSKKVMMNPQPHKHEIHSLADREKSGRKKQMLVQHGNSFLGLLLNPILKGLAELV